MCRLLGIISVDNVPFDACLLSAPRSLASLSSAHPDGWGAALYDGRTRDWLVEKRALRAAGDETFATMAPRLRGAVLVAHVRARTASAVSLANTDPFRRGKWVFAHNGTIEDLDHLRSRASRARLRECEGDTDSELLFAFLLSRLDDARVTDRGATADVDAVVSNAAAEIVERRMGTANFLLSDGAVLYAHRFGRSLHMVERRGSGAAIAIASEPLTDEAWLLFDAWTLVRFERRAGLDVAFLRGNDPRLHASDVELPFTD
jgi:glutamine amidotransferase